MHLVAAVPFAVLDFISAFAYFDVFSIVRLDDFFSTYNKGTYVRSFLLFMYLCTQRCCIMSSFPTLMSRGRLFQISARGSPRVFLVIKDHIWKLVSRFDHFSAGENCRLMRNFDGPHNWSLFGDKQKNPCLGWKRSVIVYVILLALKKITIS
jgi:hypothetical protein